jgi:hypothetical protein
MANAGDTKERFGRQYIYLNPPPNGLGTIGAWRLRVDDGGTPPIDGGGGGDADLSFRAVVAPGSPDIKLGNLVYLNALGQVELASAATLLTSAVAGMAIEGKAAGELIEFTRNEVKQIFNVNLVVDGAPTFLSPGDVYFLSMTPGNWTTSPDTTTPGAVVRSCGTALDTNQMSIEIQIATTVI